MITIQRILSPEKKSEIMKMMWASQNVKNVQHGNNTEIIVTIKHGKFSQTMMFKENDIIRFDRTDDGFYLKEE